MSTMSSISGWRSLLFVPGHVDRYIAGAHKRDADAVILDLEDAVPPSHKPAA
jgi:citrate lyase subunit beta / citryl-CoA lyase